MDEEREAVRYEQSRPSLKPIAVGAGIVGAGIAIALGAAAIFVALSGVPASGANNARRPDIPAPVLETNPRHTIEQYRREKQHAALPLGARFASDAGHATTLGDALGGKPAVLVLGYLRCSALCPTTLAGVTEALDASGLAPGRDYRALFVSIDPRDDAVTLAAAHAARIPARDRGAWEFLGGDPRAVAALTSAAAFEYRVEDSNDYAHPAGFMVVASDGIVARRFDGVRFAPAEVRAALQGTGRADSFVQQVVMFCSHLDPRTGRYSAAILAALRIACVLALALAAFAFYRTRREGR